jgi:hypothetical protein
LIKVFIPSDEKFNYKQCKKLFKKYKDKINDNSVFSDIVKNTFFYSFFDDDKFLGCIYYYDKAGKMFVNAYASPKHHLENIKCFKMSLDWFNCDIYAETTHKTAILCLYKCGFKRINENLFIYRR